MQNYVENLKVSFKDLTVLLLQTNMNLVRFYTVLYSGPCKILYETCKFYIRFYRQIKTFL